MEILHGKYVNYICKKILSVENIFCYLFPIVFRVIAPSAGGKNTRIKDKCR